MSPSPRLRLRFTASAALLLAAAPALAQDPAAPEMLLPGEKVRVVLAAGESRSIAVAGLAGGRWTIRARRAGKRSRARPFLTLVAPDDTEFALEEFSKRRGETVTASRVPFDATGVWRVRVRTPLDGEGEVELAVAAKLPRTPQPAGEIGAGGDGALAFDALPGSTCDLSVTLRDTAGPVSADLTQPDGASLASAASETKKVRLRGVVTGQLGTHGVALASSPGRFRGSLRVRPPKPRRGLVIGDVESAPQITGFAPGGSGNDSIIVVTLDGHGFDPGQRATLRRVGFPGPVAQVAIAGFPGRGEASFDLEDVVPGDHTVEVRIPSGRIVLAPGTFAITNRPAEVLTVTPKSAPNGRTYPMDVGGGGFDADATFDVVPSGGGAPFPLTGVQRVGSGHLRGTVTLPALHVGGCDVVVHGEGAARPTLADAIDVYGRMDPDLTLREVTGYEFFIEGAIDEEMGLAVLAFQGSNSTGFVTVDMAARTVVRSGTSVGFRSPHVRFHPQDHTWCVSTVTTVGQSERASARVYERDFQTPRGPPFEVTSQQMDWIVPAPLRTGGWRHVWVRRTTTNDAYLESRGVDPMGLPVGSTVEHQFDTNGILGYPDTLVRPDGRVLVVYLTRDVPNLRVGVVQRIVDPDGVEQVPVESVIAIGPDWDGVYAPVIVPDDTGARPSVCFLYEENGMNTPVVVPLIGDNSQPLRVVEITEARSLVAVLPRLVWSRARSEFLCTVTPTELSVTVRRLDRDGNLRPQTIPESYEGVTGGLVPWGDEVGLVRMHDGVDDGVFDPDVSTYQNRFFRIR